jgi:glutaredoxin
MSRAGRAWLTSVALVAAACRHHLPALGASELAHIHRSCAAHIADGSFELHARPEVGLGPRTPHGAPVVVYGASWCVACEDATNYLKLQGIPFVERDVETDAGKAASERALHVAGLAPTSSLPVIDVRGTVTIGFWPCVIDAAWAAE